MEANSSQFVTGPPARDIAHSGLDTTPAASRTWHAILINEAGRVAIYPLGSVGVGKPYEIGNVLCQQSNYSSPHDNAAKWDIKWDVNGVWTYGAIAA